MMKGDSLEQIEEWLDEIIEIAEGKKEKSSSGENLMQALVNLRGYVAALREGGYSVEVKI